MCYDARRIVAFEVQRVEGFLHRNQSQKSFTPQNRRPPDVELFRAEPKMMNAGKMKEYRVEMLKKLLELGRNRRVNQYV